MKAGESQKSSRCQCIAKALSHRVRTTYSMKCTHLQERNFWRRNKIYKKFLITYEKN